MFELFCPMHGIPAFISWVFLGGDPQLLYLTLLLWRDKVTTILGRAN
jgi:hypothetical protein